MKIFGKMSGLFLLLAVFIWPLACTNKTVAPTAPDPSYQALRRRTNTPTRTKTPTPVRTSTFTKTRTPVRTSTFTKTPTFSSTPIPKNTGTYTQTPTFTSTNTPTSTNTNASLVTFTPTMTCTSTSTGCAKTQLNFVTGVPPVASAPGPVTIFRFQVIDVPGLDKWCPKVLNGISCSVSLSGNLPTEIIESQLYNGVTLVATSPVSLTTYSYQMHFTGLNDTVSGINDYRVALLLTPQATGEASFTSSWWSFDGHQVGYTSNYLPLIWQSPFTTPASVTIYPAATPTTTP